MINRKGNKAKIMIRIPYDRYVTMDERKVMARYSIRTKDLPYFIFYHECYHLLDVCSHINQFGPESLHQYQTALSRAVQDTADYRSLDIEHGADEYAFRQYSLLSEKAG